MKFGKKKEKESVKTSVKRINKKYLKNGSYSMMISVLFIVIVVVINLIIGELPSKYTEIDVSNSQLYTIGEQTKSVLKDLKEDVTIYQVAESSSVDETLSNLLKKYEDESSHIKVVQKDPVVNPQFVSEYTDSDLSSNSLIVVCGDRNKR